MTPVYMIFEVIMEMLIPLLMASIIDDGVEKSDIRHIYLMGALMIIAAFAGLTAGVMGGKYGARASAGFAKNLREGMFVNIQGYSFENIDKTVSDEAIGALIIVGQPGELSHTASLISKLYALNLPLFITPGLHQLMTLRPRLTSVTNEPLVDITNANIPAATVNLKRLGDIVVSSVALILLMPVYAVLALSVRLDSPGPVFYRQCRIGYHKRPFDIIKFRTMRTDAEEAGPALSADEDPRITRLGKILRKYRLDELPQFWNVLKGEMSLVGPRPEREFYIRQIMERQPAYSLIHQVRPGITSWGMVKFGYATSVDEMIERLRYDLLYLENVSFGVDLKILFHTVSTVLCGRGL